MAKADTDKRPEWPHKMSMDMLLKLSYRIKSVSHHWKFTSEDTSADWVEFSGEGFKNIKEPQGFKDLFKYQPDHRCLFQLTWEGEKAIVLAESIQAFDKKNKAELALYERLKKKYEGI